MCSVQIVFEGTSKKLHSSGSWRSGANFKAGKIKSAMKKLARSVASSVTVFLLVIVKDQERLKDNRFYF